MDATATPRGISLAVGELGARGRPTFYMTSRTAVSVNRISSRQALSNESARDIVL